MPEHDRQLTAGFIDPPRAGKRGSRVVSEAAKPEGSPYAGSGVGDREAITRQLIQDHPLSTRDIVATALEAWDVLFTDPLPGKLYIGRDITPKAQTMGLLLHALISRLVARSNPEWHEERTPADMDLVYDPDDRFSCEIKTSSDRQRIFGNRSYGQLDTGRGKKTKSGYYIAVNFDAWKVVTEGDRPEIVRIRFGWLDHTDWAAQVSSTGQQSNLAAVVENYQLLTIYER